LRVTTSIKKFMMIDDDEPLNKFVTW